MNFGVALFYTTSSAMRAQKILKSKGYEITLVPTPRQFSSDCGIAVRFNWLKHGAVEADLEDAKVEVQAIHELKS